MVQWAKGFSLKLAGLELNVTLLSKAMSMIAGLRQQRQAGPWGFAGQQV